MSKKHTKEMTQEVCNAMFDCRFDEGITISRRTGKRVGNLDRRGKNVYRRIDCRDYGMHYEHRLHYLSKHGRWPQPVVHHRNGIGTDNRNDNIDEASFRRNRWECIAGPGHSTGCVNIYRAGRRYICDMTTTTEQGRVRFRKAFPTFVEALVAKIWAWSTYRSVG